MRTPRRRRSSKSEAPLAGVAFIDTYLRLSRNSLLVATEYQLEPWSRPQIAAFGLIRRYLFSNWFATRPEQANIRPEWSYMDCNKAVSSSIEEAQAWNYPLFSW